MQTSQAGSNCPVVESGGVGGQAEEEGGEERKAGASGSHCSQSSQVRQAVRRGGLGGGLIWITEEHTLWFRKSDSSHCVKLIWEVGGDTCGNRKTKEVRKLLHSVRPDG